MPNAFGVSSWLVIIVKHIHDGAILDDPDLSYRDDHVSTVYARALCDKKRCGATVYPGFPRCVQPGVFSTMFNDLPAVWVL